MPERRRATDLDRLFHPRVVAVIGASEKERSQQRGQWLKVRDTLGPQGVMTIPINPRLESVLGTRAYASVLDVPHEIDVAVIVVRDPLPVLAECVAKRVKFAIVFSAGFGEVGSEEGMQRQRALEALCDGTTRVLGPNTNLNIFEPPAEAGGGKMLAVLTQSGFQGRPIVQAPAVGIGVASWTTLGNEVDLEFADFVHEYATWDHVGAIVGYVEGFNDGDRFRQAVDFAAEQQVPVVLIKVGRSESGQRAAAAHTAHVTGNDAVHDAVFDQHGVIRVDDIDELIEIGGMFCRVGGPVQVTTGGVGVYALSGGSSAHVTDLLSARGVRVPQLDATTIERLHEHIPTFLQVGNPVDTGGTLGGTPAGVATLELLLADPNIDVVVVPITGVFPGMSDAIARDIAQVKEQGAAHGKPILVAWSSPLRDDTTLDLLAAAEVPVFFSVARCVDGVRALLKWSSHVTDLRSSAHDGRRPGDAAPERRANALRILHGRPDTRILNEVDAKRLLGLYGIPTPRESLAHTDVEAAELAAELGPVALKVVSADIPHKSDVGLVVLNVTEPDAARQAFVDLRRTAALHCPDARIDGVLVQSMVTDAVVEVLVGASRQAPFGLTIAVGLGGVFVEVLRDVSLGVPPFDDTYARTMIERLRGNALLRGTRSLPPADVDALIDVVMGLAEVTTELGDEIEAIDINPLMVRPAGLGVVAVDALIERRVSPDADHDAGVAPSSK